MPKIFTYDSTLRDGEQCEGISLSLEDKLLIARRLDKFGVDFIEGGFPASNPKDIAFFKALAEKPLEHAKLAAFGSTCKKYTSAAQDKGLADLLACGAPVVTIVGKTWDEQVTRALQTTLDENLRMIADSVAHLKAAGRYVVFDAEHFFDGYKANAEYALECVRAAARAGADSIDLCETNGGALPFEVEEIVAACVRALADAAGAESAEGGALATEAGTAGSAGAQSGALATEAGAAGVRLGIHCHNDSGCAVANTLAAVRAGVTQVQGTINGLGERVGNTDLLTVIADLELKMDCVTVGEENLKHLTDVSNFVAEIAGVGVGAHHPYTGTSAFAHKGGLHASAIARFPQAYEHVSPERVGNNSRMVVSELAGKASLIQKAQALGIDLEGTGAGAGAAKSAAKSAAGSTTGAGAGTAKSAGAAKGTSAGVNIQAILDDIKRREAAGYTYEVADGSLALLLMKHLKTYKPAFTLESFRVIVDDREDTGALAKDASSEATIKIHVCDSQGNDHRFVATGEGTGPVGALDNALRMAISESIPQIKDMELVDYKVRLPDESQGTGAITRVTITTADKFGTYGTVGVSENVIEASWNALVESIEYGLIRLENAKNATA